MKDMKKEQELHSLSSEDLLRLLNFRFSHWTGTQSTIRQRWKLLVLCESLKIVIAGETGIACRLRFDVEKSSFTEDNFIEPEFDPITDF